MKQTVQLTVRQIQQQFSALLGDTGNREGGAPEAVRCLNEVLNPDSWPEGSANLTMFGEKEIDFLLSFFERVLLRYVMVYNRKVPEATVKLILKIFK